jgi:hypothetical protein
LDAGFTGVKIAAVVNIVVNCTADGNGVRLENHCSTGVPEAGLRQYVGLPPSFRRWSVPEVGLKKHLGSSSNGLGMNNFIGITCG